MLHTQFSPAPDLSVAHGHKLYLMVDGSQIAKIEQQLYQQLGSPTYEPVYLFPPWDALREVTPCLVQATPALTTWFLENAAPNHGYFFSSAAPLSELAQGMRTLIQAETPYGSLVLFKMAHSEAAWVLFADGSPWIWQGIDEVWVPTRSGWQQRQRPQTLAPPQGERLKFSDPQWQALGQISWRTTLAAITEHMQTWFPKRLTAYQNNPNWISDWAMQAYQLGFSSERDLLLFFNILGYLDEHVLLTDQFAEIKTLLQHPNQNTPAQRVEQAAELAYQFSQQELPA